MTPWLTWTTFWRLLLGPRPEIVVVYSNGARLPIGFFASWFALDRPPYFVVKIVVDGTDVWKRRLHSR